MDVDEEELEMEAHMDAMDEAMFGDDAGETHYPQGNELNWNDHFLNGRESGAGPDVENNSVRELVEQGYTKHEIAEAIRKLADKIDG